MKKIMYIGLVFMIMLIGLNSVNAKSCSSYKKKTTCENSQDPACVWNSKYKVCTVNGLVYAACGSSSELGSIDDICDGKTGNSSYDIPVFLPEIVSFAVNALKIATPIILIFVGMISLVKAIASSNEEDIKKAQNSLVKKILIAVMIFFVISITQFVINKVSDDDNASAKGCLECFLNNDCTIYYRDDSKTKDQCVRIN